MDKNELTIQALREALRERVSTLTDEYENKIVGLRIEVTELSLALQEAHEKINSFESAEVPFEPVEDEG